MWEKEKSQMVLELLTGVNGLSWLNQERIIKE